MNNVKDIYDDMVSFAAGIMEEFPLFDAQSAEDVMVFEHMWGREGYVPYLGIHLYSNNNVQSIPEHIESQRWEDLYVHIMCYAPNVNAEIAMQLDCFTAPEEMDRRKEFIASRIRHIFSNIVWQE